MIHFNYSATKGINKLFYPYAVPPDLLYMYIYFYSPASNSYAIVTKLGPVNIQVHMIVVTFDYDTFRHFIQQQASFHI